MSLSLSVVLAVSSARGALPTVPQVVHGNVAIAQAGSAMTVTQTSSHAIVNWQSFNIGTGESLRLVQSGASAAMLARVTGSDPSQLLGSLQADGKLFLINPKGILIGAGAVIDTASFMATTLDVADADFIAGGALNFSGDSTASVVNLGRITAREGNVMLFAHTVKNAGEINAPKGTAGLGAAREVYLASPDDATFVVEVNVSSTTETTGVENSGVIAAVQAELKAADGSIYNLAVNQSGIIRATGVTTRDGRVILTADSGAVQVSGNVTARNANGSGGEILVGTAHRPRASSFANATRTTIAGTSRLDASGASDSVAAGRAVVWASDTTTFLGNLTARGAGGGFAEIAGNSLLDFRPGAIPDVASSGTLQLGAGALHVGTTNPGTSGTSFLSVAALQSYLAASNVTLDTSLSPGDITFGSALTWGANTLTAKSGADINVNANLTGGAGSSLFLQHGKTASPRSDGPDLMPWTSLDENATVAVGTLSVGINPDAAPVGYRVSTEIHGYAPLDGVLNVSTLQIDLAAGPMEVVATNPANALGLLRTSGTGSLRFTDVADGSGGLDVMLVSPSSRTNLVRVSTPGTLTLKSGTSLGFTIPGNVVLASTGGAFVNQAGASPFGTNARYLIYTSTPAATTRGGLAPTYVFNKTYDPADAFTTYNGDTTSRLIYSGSKATVTFTANNQSRVYGDANATPTATATGFVDGDTLATSGIAGAPTLAHAATLLSNVGNHAITAANGTLAGTTFYDVAVANGTLAVTPAPLAIAVENKSRTYGDANPTFTATFTGLKNSELPAAAGTLSFTPGADQNSNVGTYAINAALTAANPNYAPTITAGTLTVNKAPLTVSVSNSITKAQGAPNPSFLPFTTASGLKLSDTLAIAIPNLAFDTLATTTSPDGTYLVTPTGTSANYSLSFNAGLLTISTVVLPTLTYRADNASRVYGDANPMFNFTRTGLLGGTPDDVTGAPMITTFATQSSGVGSYVLDIQRGTLRSNNYQFSFVPGSLTITPAPLTVAIGNASRFYGDANPTFTSTVTGMKNSEPASVAGSVAFSTAATLTSNVGSYAINGTLSGTSANYTATVTPGTLAVNPAPLTATIQNASRAPNTANPAFSATFSGFKNSETQSVISGLTFSTTAVVSSPNGSYPITGAGTATNYALTFVPGTLTIGGMLNYAATSFSRVYGDVNPSSLPYTVTGLLPGDVLGNVVTGAPALSTTATQSSGVGSYTIAIAQGTLASPSYGFTFTPGTLSVTPAPLTITANNASRNLNHPNPALTASYSGFKNGDTSAVVSGLQLATTATLASPSGAYPITLSGASAANYSINYVPGTLTVGGLALLTISANNASKTYGQPNPAFSASYSGLVNGDTASVVSGLQFSTTAAQSSGVGSYTITPFGATATGYSISYVPGTLAIERAPLTITANGASRTYGDANPAFTASFSGFVNGDNESVVSGLTFNAPGASANAGTHSITPTGGSAANYAISYRPGQLQIGKASLLVKAEDKTRVYGDPDPALTYTVSGLKNGDSAESAFHLFDLATLANVTDPVGRYLILLQGFATSQNYNVGFLNGSLTITPRPITITADNKTKIYGDPFPTYTTTITGLPSFASADAIPNLKAALLANVADGVQTVGIMPSSDRNPNYAITYRPGQLSITPATLELGAPTTAVRIYGRADELPSLVTTGGLKYSDTVASIGLAYDVPAPTANVGTYDYGYKLSNPNYKLPDTLGRGVFHVEPAPLDLQIGSTGRLYGDANPSLSLQAAGLAFGHTAGSVLKLHLPDETADVGVYTASPELTSQNYYLRSVAGGRLQINPRTISFEIDNIARYYGDANPAFTYKLNGSGFASFDSLDTVFRGFRTAMNVDAMTNVGVYRIDPIFEANPNYHVSWTPGFLAIMPRPITLTINNAIAFGNDNAPANFSVVGTGLDWVKNTATAGSYQLTGFTATATNLPAGVSLADIFPNLGYQTSFTNSPQPVANAADLSKVFPPKPEPAAPQPTSAPVPEGWIAFQRVDIPINALSTTNVTSTYHAVPLAVLDGGVVFNPTGEQKSRERFSDQTLYVSPTGLVNNNYAVTGITNGVLTMKADQAVLANTLAVEAAAAKRAADRSAFYDGPGGAAKPGEIRISRPGAFGMSKDLFPSIRDALGHALNLEFLNKTTGEPGSLAKLITGPNQATSWDQISEDQIMAWLADLHTNPAKQAVIMPTLMAYAVNAASLEPGRRSAQDEKLLAFITPALANARATFAGELTSARDSWVDVQGANRSATFQGLLNGKMPYEQFIAAAVGATMAEAQQAFEAKAQQSNTGGAIAVEFGVGTGALAALDMFVIQESLQKIFPHAKKGFKLAAERAVKAAAEQGVKKVAGDLSAKMAARATSSLAGGVGTILSLAVTILISESTAIADNEKAAANFNALLAPGASNDPHALVQSDAGKAIMMLGMARLFMGGGGS